MPGTMSLVQTRTAVKGSLSAACQMWGSCLTSSVVVVLSCSMSAQPGRHLA